MDIHVVQRGETIFSIADLYGVPVDQLIMYNGIPNPYNLVEGQSIIILYPVLTYTVVEGDTLDSIALAHNISVMQLLRNNPFLSDRGRVYPGEILIVDYGVKKGRIITNGYTNPFINRDILIKTLPFLTYLTIFGYMVTEVGEIIEPDDDEVIEIANEYQVAPIMLISTLTLQGFGSPEAAYNILYNENIVNRYIENILLILRRKRLYGVNFIYSFLTAEHEEVYNNFTQKVTQRLNSEGYSVFISIPPMIAVETNVITFERINYSTIGTYANHIVVMNYNWGFNYGPPMPVESEYMLRQYIDYLVTLIPVQKIFVGIPIMGYTWLAPYILGLSRASSLTVDSAIMLAFETGSVIQFDEVSKTPYYEYIDISTGVPREYIVWFIDARSIEAFVNLQTDYNIPATAIWNIMTYNQQLWQIINSQYEIIKLLL